MSNRLIAATGGLALAATSMPSLAQTASEWTSIVETPSLILERHPRTARTWQLVVPKAFKKTRWVYRLEGNASQTRIVRSAGRSYALGSVCKPHDCQENTAAFLIALDGRRAAGALRLIRRGRPQETFFGNPTPQERTLLLFSLTAGAP